MHTSTPVFIPFRDSDLAYIRNACQACAETIHARAGLPAECLSSAGWCLLIDQSASAHRWHPDPQKAERCHLIDLFEHDQTLGIYSLSTRAIGGSVPASQYVAVCARPHLRAAAEYLWTHCLGAAIAARYYGIDKHLFETADALGLKEQPVNHEPPCYSMIRSGALLRFDASTAPQFHRYFLLDDTLSTEPRSIELGGGSSLTYRYSENPLEPAVAILGNDNPWNVERAVKELRRLSPA
jgi:hypothetical protein